MHHNLLFPLDNFIGRGRELAEIRQLLGWSRLVTLTGAGGCGKTRLATELALRSGAPRPYRDGVWLVELAALADPSLVPQRIATTLQVREQPGEAVLRTLQNYLQDKELLLLLDNCEHLIEACAQCCAALLQTCAQLQCLATSREALNISGEQVYLVPPLPVPAWQPERSPAPGKRAAVNALAQNESVRLFVARAKAGQARFALSRQNAPAVAQICARLDGIPLAIELAAARVKTLGPDEIAARLDNVFQLLTRGRRSALPRQQTMHAALEWSYDLLGEPEQMLFRRLAVFAGGWTLTAAQEACGDQSVASASDGPGAVSAGLRPPEIVDLLAQLVNKSLVLAAAQGEETRFRMLEPIRQYAHAKAVSAGELPFMQMRHFNFYVALAERSDSQLRGPGQASWLQRLETEHENLRAALEWSLETGSARDALRMAGALHWFWSIRSLTSEGGAYAARALALPSPERATALRAKALTTAGSLAWEQGDNLTARELLEQSLALARALDERQGAAHALTMLGMANQFLGDAMAARAHEAEAVAMLRDGGDPWLLAMALNCSGYVLCLGGLTREAKPFLEESLALFQALGERWATGMPQANLADLAWQEDRVAEAGARFGTSLAIYQETGDRIQAASTLVRLGLIAQQQADYQRALGLHRQALALQRELGTNSIGVSFCCFARLAAVHGNTELAARLFAAGFKTRGPDAHPSLLMKRQIEPVLKIAREQLGEQAFASAWAAGDALTLEQACSEAQAITPQSLAAAAAPHAPAAASAYPAGLSEREVDVLRLVARGLSNQEIADQLVLSLRTVHAHMRSIFNKLDVTSRSAAARAALEAKLL